MKQLFIIYVLLFYFPQIIISQFEHFNIEDGLSQSNVRCMLIDKNGFIWLGTEDGLNRFDGYGFKIFKHQSLDSNSLSGNYINALMEDREGNIWIGTSAGGLNKYNPITGRFTHYLADTKNKNALQSNVVLSVFQDSDGFIWIGTYQGGLSKYNPQTNLFTTYFTESGNTASIGSNSITNIYEDHSGRLWIATFDAGLNLYDKIHNKFIRYQKSNKYKSISSNYVTIISELEKDTLLIGTNAGLNIFYVQERKFEAYTHDSKNKNTLSNNFITSIFVDKKKKIWIGTSGGGLNLFYLKIKKFISYQPSRMNIKSINSYGVNCIVQDRSGLIWIGTHTGGLNKLNTLPMKFQHFINEPDNENSISNNSTRVIFEDNSGNVWIGTDNGLNRIDSYTKKVKRYFSSSIDKNSISDNFVWSITQDKEKNIWIGTQNGLNKFDLSNNKITRFKYNPVNKGSIPFNYIRCMYYDDANILWLGTYGGGLIKFDIAKKFFYTYLYDKDNSNSISDNVVLNIYEDRNGLMWISTSNGLNLFDRKSNNFTRFFHEEKNTNSLGDDKILVITEDLEGIFWIGTFGGGLTKYNKKANKFIRYTESDGLPNNVVYGILVDSKNKLWLGTNNGLCKFDHVNKTFKTYSTEDGLQSREFNAGAFLKSKSGKFYFGGINGFNSFYPDSIIENSNIPNIAITDYKVLNKSVAGREILINNQKVTLSHLENTISFEFSALDFLNPSKNQYAYMLEGIDAEWIYSGNRRYVAYSDLSPGNYILRVKASNSDGLWNEKGIAVFILITPPYWQQWWFRILLIFLFFLVILSFHKRRLDKVIKEKNTQQVFSKQLIEAQENERKRIASELHDGLGQNLLIISNLAQIGLRNDNIDSSKKQLNSISENAIESIEEVRRIAYNLHPYQLSELGLTTAIESILKKLSDSTTLNFSIYIENIDGYFADNEQIHIFRIVQEGTNNIIKHAKTVNAIISISKINSMIQIVIKDEGIGMDIQPGNQDHQNLGLGLREMKERVMVLNGSMQIESVKQKGTTLKITIPIKQ